MKKDSSALIPAGAEKKRFVRKFTLKKSTRLAQRKALAKKWLTEIEHSHYRYVVATCEDGTEIFLSRPTLLNKGFDFTVHISGWNAPYKRSKGGKKPKRNTKPRHKDITSDLKRKKQRNPAAFRKLCTAIRKVYQCVEPEEALKRVSLKFDRGMKVDVLLHVLKWLFIEQDLTYWNGIGRRKLMGAVASICGFQFIAKESPKTKAKKKRKN